jgi:hypothetical protein
VLGGARVDVIGILQIQSFSAWKSTLLPFEKFRKREMMLMFLILSFATWRRDQKE